MSTRLRISFNEIGRRNACQWTEEKKKLNWLERQKLSLKFWMILKK